MEKIAAWEALRDTGFGKPRQSVEFEDLTPPGPPVQLIVRAGEIPPRRLNHYKTIEHLDDN
jgi:hypothetical protein